MRKDTITLRRNASISLPVAVLVAVLGLACNSPSSPSPLPSAPSPPSPPPPLATSVRYHVSGIVTDDNDSPVANAPLTLHYENTFKNIKTSTDARGYYSFVFETDRGSYDGNANFVGVITYYVSGGEYESNVQAVPSGTAEIIRNLHLRRVRNVNAGQSVVLSIDADSSNAYDGEDWLRLESVREKFNVRVADAGTLTITARPTSGGIVPHISVACVYVVDNCDSGSVDAPPGTTARHVKANSRFEIFIVIPRQVAPQRYEVSTSLR